MRLAMILVLGVLVGACSGGGTCVRHSDCRIGVCTRTGTCEVVAEDASVAGEDATSIPPIDPDAAVDAAIDAAVDAAIDAP
ncbi:MAG: hypothetical protein NT062_24640 [Proteobacteria bacterium]|nr:hypothetical protein [Pseudomonadota bacterium]